jgi:hypothetical protein
MIRFVRPALVVSALAIMATPGWAQTAPPIQNGQVDILGASQRMTSGVRLKGANDQDGNRADNRGGRGGSDNSGPGSVNSGHGSDNSGPGSANSGHGSANSGSGRGGDNSGQGGRDDNRVSQSGDVRQEDRQMDRREDRRQDHRSNSGGELRGLNRADHVAGDHGQQGRDNARAVQMDQPNRPERVDLHQRPDQLERPEREGRQGRH